MYSGTADLLNFTGNAYNTTYNDRRPFNVPNSVIQTGIDANGKPVYAENTVVMTKERIQTIGTQLKIRRDLTPLELLTNHS